MGSDVPAEQLVGLVADERLLSEDPAMLPAAVGLPEPIPTRAARRRLVGVGAALTGVTLIGGIALAILGAVELLFDGGGALAVVALVVGLVLASTHWGWVHVAELSATRHRASQQLGGRRSPPGVARDDRPVHPLRGHDQRRGRRLDHDRADPPPTGPLRRPHVRVRALGRADRGPRRRRAGRDRGRASRAAAPPGRDRHRTGAGERSRSRPTSWTGRRSPKASTASARASRPLRRGRCRSRSTPTCANRR